MGCLAAIECLADNRGVAERALEAAFLALSQVERLMHPTRTGGDLARLNAARAGEHITVHPWTDAVLRLCRKLHALSGGLFDPALPGKGSVANLRSLKSQRVLVRRPVNLDLGGIAKGFAVDRAIQHMKAQGACSGLVNVGGDLRVFGAESWPIALRLGHGLGQARPLRNCALAVSDPGAGARPAEHQGYYAPRVGVGAGVGARALPFVAVQARTAALADGMTKVLMFAPVARRGTLSRQAGVRFLAIDTEAPASSPAPPADHPGRTWPAPRTTYL
jgi:FAD:protein FMN transferase